MMEKWEEVFKGAIPHEKYCTRVTNGEKSGLIVQLECDKYEVIIKFGAISSFRMIDEGIILKSLYDDDTIKPYKDNQFSNIIYKVQNGEFDRFVRSISNELYNYFKLKHFAIITQNYAIEIITEWEPTIEVKNLY